jgi:hypothetical protein
MKHYYAYEQRPEHFGARSIETGKLYKAALHRFKSKADRDAWVAADDDTRRQMSAKHAHAEFPLNGMWGDADDYSHEVYIY